MLFAYCTQLIAFIQKFSSDGKLNAKKFKDM